MSLLAEFRLNRIAPLMNDPRIPRIVEGLKRDNFLRGTVVEARSRAQGVDPYDFLFGFIVGSIVGSAVTMIVGAVTIEFWLPRAIARFAGKTLQETTREVSRILAVPPAGVMRIT